MSDVDVSQSVVEAVVKETAGDVDVAQAMVQLVASSPSSYEVAQSVVLVLYKPRPPIRKQSIVVVAN